MKILIVGEGGREHALVWALHRSPSVQALYAAPGNAGIGQVAECVPIGAEDAEGLAAYAEAHRIDLTVVGPDGALAAGVVDQMMARGIKTFGPTRAAARIEWSKSFAKKLMEDEGIPTAAYASFSDINEAKAYIRRRGAPILVKADGLAAGKGAVVCHSVEEALQVAEGMLIGGAFGEAGARIVVEEFLEGEEASVLAITDGATIRVLLPSQDHKHIYEGDKGPNTGGMGAYAPAPVVDQRLMTEIESHILEPAIRAMAARGIPYKGVLYAGLMITDHGPKVFEFNSRFGDPEAQVLLPLLKTDLTDILLAVCTDNLSSVTLEWHPKAATCVVLASNGYPGAYEKGKPITGLDKLAAMEDVIPFHANTAVRDGRLVTNGGRVVGITALAPDLASSITRAYEVAEYIHFDGCYYRRDIGQKALKYLT